MPGHDGRTSKDTACANRALAQHPDEMKRLQKHVEAMDADLGVAKQGPGVRPPSRVQKPQPLLLK